MRPDPDDTRLYISRIRPIYHQLFNITHAICGDSRRAEYALQCAILNYWQETARAQRREFRDGLRNTLVQTAFRTAMDKSAAPGEITWDGLNARGDDPVLALIGSETREMRRMLALKYGVNASCLRIGRLMQMEPARVQTALMRFEARTRRRLGGVHGAKYDALMRRAVRMDFAAPCAVEPDVNAVLRAFQADASSAPVHSHTAAHILRWALTGLLILICIAAFWVIAILI